MLTRLCFLIPLILFVFAAPAFAHDCWLAPQSFYIVQGAFLSVALLVGDRFTPEKELPLDKEITKSFILTDRTGDVDLLEKSEPGADPVLTRRIDGEPGEMLISMERDFTYIELDDEKFTGYLEHEYQDRIIEMRSTMGPRKAERELYARCIKSLVLAGEPGNTNLHKKILGHRLEIVLLSNPCLLEKGGQIRAQALFDGQPLTDRVISAYQTPPEGGFFAYTARTDKDGQARFEVTGPGTWMLRLVHMIPNRDTNRADWQSFWGAYSFEIRG